MHDIAGSIDPLPKVWDPDSRVGDMLRGRRGLVVGIADENSIAYGCAVKLRAFGAELAVTYLNEKSEPYVRPLRPTVWSILPRSDGWSLSSSAAPRPA
jgi:enoyl-[acyl-carrier protein] reductase I